MCGMKDIYCFVFDVYVVFFYSFYRVVFVFVCCFENFMYDLKCVVVFLKDIK